MDGLTVASFRRVPAAPSPKWSWRAGDAEAVPARTDPLRDGSADVRGRAYEGDLQGGTGVRVVDVRRLALDVDLQELINDHAARADITRKELPDELAGGLTPDQRAVRVEPVDLVGGGIRREARTHRGVRVGPTNRQAHAR